MQSINRAFFPIFIILSITTNLIYSQPFNSKIDDLQFSKHYNLNLLSSTDRAEMNGSKSFFSCMGSVLTEPLRWDENNLLHFGGFIGITTGSFLLDHEVNHFFKSNRNEILDKLEPVGYYYGSPATTIPSVLALYVSGVLFDDPWLEKTGLMLTEAITIIGIIQVPSRIIFGRARPYINEDNDSFEFLTGLKQERASFISGHSALAFGISNILAHQIDNPFATIGLFSLAAITPISRLYADKHWFSDVMMGSLLGIIISNQVIAFNEQDNSQKRISLLPSYDGLSIVYRF